MLEPLSAGRHTISVGANYGVGDEPYGHMLQNFESILDVGCETLLTQAFAKLRPDAG